MHFNFYVLIQQFVGAFNQMIPPQVCCVFMLVKCVVELKEKDWDGSQTTCQLCSNKVCYAMLACHFSICIGILYFLCYAVLFFAVLCNAMTYKCLVQYGRGKFGMVWQRKACYSMVTESLVWYGRGKFGIVQQRKVHRKLKFVDLFQ